MLPVADYLYRSGKGVFYPPKTTKGKKKEGKCGEKGKKCGKKKGKKTKGGKKKDRKKVKGKSKAGKTERAKKEERKTTKSEMEKSRKLFAATRLTLGFLGTNFFTFIIMKNYIVGKGVLFL